MKNFSFLAGLSLFIIYACLGIYGKNMCWECKNLDSCVGPEQYSYHPENQIYVINYLDNITYNAALEQCVPTGFEIQGTIGYYFCFHKPFCKLVVGTQATATQLDEYCHFCATECQCTTPAQTDEGSNKCWACENMEKCVGPEAISLRSKDAESVQYLGTKITYHPDLEQCVPQGYRLNKTISDYVCFHKPYCRMAVGYDTTGWRLGKYCEYCADSCKCTDNGDTLSISESLTSIFFGILATGFLL